MRILIVKTSAIGDVTHTLPALHALRRRFPAARIDWLVEEAAAGLITGHPYLNRVLISRRKNWIKECRQGRVAGVAREAVSLIRELRRVRYEMVLDFQGLLKSSVFVLLARAKRKIGFDKGMEHAEGSYLFLNEKIPPVSMDLHAVDREKAILTAIDVHEEGRYALLIGREQHQRAAALLHDHGLMTNRPLVAINPMTTWPTKHWTNEGFAAVADTLVDQGMNIFFTGSPQDRPAIDVIIARMSRQGAVNLAGKTDLLTLAALYRRCRTVVSTDTGPMHIAAAAGTPVVALFGPTAPWRTGPYGKQHRVIRRDEMDCGPCFRKTCATTRCMRAIEPAVVVAAVNDLLRADQHLHSEQNEPA